MATLKDLYQILSKADTGGIDKASKSLEGNAGALGKLGNVAKGIGSGLAVAGQAMQGLKSIGEALGGMFDKLAATSPEFALNFERVKGQFGEVQNMLMAPIADALSPVLHEILHLLADPKFKEFINKIGVALGDIFSQIGGIVVEDLLPVLLDLVETVLPPFLDLAKAILQPLGDLLRAILPPLVDIIKKLAGVFGSVLEALAPVIIQIAEALIPPLLDLIDQLLPVILPLIEQLAGVFGDVLAEIAPLIAEGLQVLLPILMDLLNLILPPLADALGWVATTVASLLGDALKWLRDFIKNDLGPILSWLNDNILQPLIGAFNGIVDAVKSVIDWFGDLWDGLQGLEDALPEWLKPGSPPPLEVGLRGIADALKGIDLGGFGGPGGGSPPAAGAMTGGLTAPLIVNLSVNGPFGQGYTPQQAGAAAGNGLVDALRARGVQV